MSGVRRRDEPALPPGSESATGALAARLRSWLPEGGWLRDDAWWRRHRALLVLLWLHAVGLPILGLLRGVEPAHALGESGLVALAAASAGWTRLSRDVRALCASAGLVTASAVLVHFSGGYVEMHFHFFVVVALIALYQDWRPFLLAIGYVLVHHGVLGVLAPTLVYNHPDAIAQPWLWAVVHAGFVLAASAAAIAAWRLNEQQALYDALTALPNRVLLLERAQHALRRQRPESLQVALLFLDLDGFKHVNDSLGHPAGDRLLELAAGRLRRAVRSSDLVARLGGDEFVVLLAGLAARDDALAAARRVVEGLGAPFDLDGRPATVGVSVGLAFAGPGVALATELLRRADIAMYQAKAQGKGRYAVFEDGDGPARPLALGARA